MNNFSKLMLSAEEQELVNNSNWILTKRVILDKVQLLLGELSEKQKGIVLQHKEFLPATVVRSDAKISKGENYLQLPFLILDYPRCFEVENIFAVRTMFWWGNFFSITIHLSGFYKEKYQQQLINGFDKLKQNDFYLCIHESQWQHHFEEDNYIAFGKLTNTETAAIVKQQAFVKLAKRFPLQQWHDMPMLLERSFTEIIKLLKT